MGAEIGAALAAVVRRGVRTAACLVLALLAAVTVGAVARDQAQQLTLDPAQGAASARGLSSPAAGPQVRKAEHLARSFDCSRTGFGSEVVPRHALVRQDGKVRLTSFDEGWAVYRGDARGTLLSVCKR